MNICGNCSAEFAGTYCTICGQKTNSGRIYFKELANDFLANFFALDSPPFLTIKMLTVKPGEAIQEFISGKRKKYYKPVQYFILMVAFYLLIRAITGFNPIENQYRAMGRELPSPEIMNSIPMQASYLMAGNINILLFVFVFIFSFFTRLFFRKSGYYYVEHLVFSFYSIGHYIFLSTFIIFLSFINPELYHIVYLVLVSYLTFSLLSFHKPKLVAGLLMGIVSVIISFIIYVAAVYISTVYYVRIFLR